MNIIKLFIFAGLILGLVITPSIQAKNGSELYGTFCAACHGTDGKGDIPGTPDFTSQSGPLAKDEGVLSFNINNGFQTPGNSMAMPPKGGNPNLSDEDTKLLVQFLKQSFYPG